MYAATVDGQRLDFTVSGMLWKRSLVMRDEETETLWSHILGKGMRGKLQGTELNVLPSLMTDWRSWKTAHPKTTAILLNRTARGFNQDMYRSPENFLVGLRNSKKSKAWRFDHLQKQPVVNDFWNEKPVVINLLVESFSSAIFFRTLDGQDLLFEIDDQQQIIDRQTQSKWNLQVGLCTEGKLKGKRLRQLSSIPSFTTAWAKYYPASQYWSPSKKTRVRQ